MKAVDNVVDGANAAKKTEKIKDMKEQSVGRKEEEEEEKDDQRTVKVKLNPVYEGNPQRPVSFDIEYMADGSLLNF